MTVQYDENMGGWYDDGQSNDFAAAPDTAPATPDFAVQPAPAQSLAVPPAPDQSLAVQPAPTVKSGMVNERGMGPNADDPYNGMGPPDLAVTPAIGGQDFAVNPQSAAPDYAAYTNAYPDLAAAAQAAGMDPATFGAMHYAQSGKTEGRAVPPGGAAPTDPSLAVRSIGDTGAAPIDTSNFAVFGNTGIRYGVDPSGQAFFNNQPISAEDYAVLTRNAAVDPSLAVNPDGTPNTAPVNIAEGVRFNPEGLTDPATATVSTTPASAAAFDYSSLVTGEPQLQNGPLQLNGGRTFNAQGPYYAPRTNSGDAAGAVYAGPGQKVRMIDPKTGDVVFEGVGPEGAKQATALADAMSVNKGKKSSWEIQGDFGDQGWKGMAQDLVDPKRNLLGKLADIVLPIIGVALALTPGGQVFIAGLLAGGTASAATAAAIAAGTASTTAAAAIGAAAGSALSSVGQGRSVGDTLTRAAISGLAAGAGAHFFPAAPAAAATPATGSTVAAAATPATGSTVAAVAPPAMGNFVPTLPNIATPVVANGAKNTIAELVVIGPSRAAQAAAQAAQAAARAAVINGSAGSTLANVALNASNGTNTMQGGDGPPAKPDNLAGTPPPAADTLVEEVAVTGIRQAVAQNPNITLAALREIIPEATAQLLANALAEPLTTRPRNDAGDPRDPREISPASVKDLTTPATAEASAAANVLKNMSLLDAIKAGVAPAWLAAHPLEAASLVNRGVNVANLVVGAVTGGGSGGSGGGGAGGTSTLQQQQANLPSIFRAQLGAPRGMFSALGSAGTPYSPRPISNITPGYAVRPTGTTGTTGTTDTTDTTDTSAYGVPGAASLNAYLALYPDVAAEGARDPRGYGDADGDGTITARDFALGHYLRYGVNEGRTMGVKAGGAIHGYSHGSSTRRDFAVQGPGTGRSDSIPAVLSDGEYVMDAETVALLGDGSSKAGARRLDQFRTNLRKQKGRNLAKGRFSVNAKAPEAYLSGGRT